jgi:ATP-dependent Lon protease
MTKRKARDDDNGSHEPMKRVRKDSTDVVWVKDTTIPSDPPPPSDEEELIRTYIMLLLDEPLPSTDSDDSTYQTEDDEPPPPPKPAPKPKPEKPALPLTSSELAYFKKCSPDRQRELNVCMKRAAEYLSESSDIPLRFRIMELPVSDFVKATALKKLERMEEEDHESHKLRNWIDGFVRIPFGVVRPVPVSLADGREACSTFMRRARAVLDEAVYGMVPAKTHILQILAQWIANPRSVGTVLALQGPAGIGKTSLARQGLAEALQRPFEFISLGGASDIANFIGHSYTYEGSMWGRIVDCIMHAKCMNPVFYFDELDKISQSVQGDEITSLLIHLTDRSQNEQFHDRYFAGIDFDLSQCLFVCSFNDIEKVHPILRDRMQVIHCSGYNEVDKRHIVTDYIWPELVDRVRFQPDDIQLPSAVIDWLIHEYSSHEKGVRSLIRCLETIVTRLNMIRIADEEVCQSYKFYVPVTFPVTLTIPMVQTILHDLARKEPETWRHMYM